MIKIIDGQVYETTEVATETQTAIVTPHKCGEHKIKLSYANGALMVEYKDWQDNPVPFDGTCTVYVRDALTGVAKKSKIKMNSGVATHQITEPSEYTITASIEGADGDSLFVEVE